jgi:HPt (histidine-containing phosphotransfer) domain-containing protein
VFPQEKKFLLEKGFHLVMSKPFHEEELMKMFGISQASPLDTGSEAGDEIDLEPLRKMTLYDENLLHTVIEQFREETTMELTQLEHAIAKCDRIKVRDIAHKLAGRVGQVGVLSLSLKLRDTETRIEKGEDFDSLLPGISAQREEVKRLVTQLSDYLVAKS